MIKLFIVDDEIDTREGLRLYFDWSKYNIEVIGEADDGSTALEPILKEKPDIVLSDIRMPDMDGMQLAKKIRESGNNTKIIFVSGYDDLEYLKSALKVDAIDYILKPVDLEELARVIEKVTKIINGENEEKKLKYEMNVKLMESMPTLREKFFMTLVRDSDSSKTGIDKKIKFLELSLPSDSEYCVIVISIDDKAAEFDELSEMYKQMTSFSIVNICEELINREMKGYAFENRQGEYVCILELQCYEDEDKLYLLISEIKSSLLRFLKLSVTIGVGMTVYGLENVGKSYSKAYENASHKLFLGKNKIITIDSLETEEDYIYKFDYEKAQRLTNILKSTDESKLVSAIECIFKDISKYRNANVKYCLNVCLQLILTGSRLLMEMQINIEDTTLDENQVWEQFFKLETLEDMKIEVTKYFLSLCGYISRKRNKKSCNVIEEIKGIINLKYKENVSVNDISKEVFLSTTYLCMVFKRETGETVNEYMTKIRIDRAKALLMDNHNKLYDICYEIGYTEPGYFSKIFKKYTGLSPSDYRESQIWKL